MSEEELASFLGQNASDLAASGGVERETARLRGLIEAEADVKRVMALEVLPGGEPRRWVYLIETPYMTFPKFAVGTTNAENTEVSLLLTCGSEWAATAGFNQVLLNGGELPPEAA